MVDEELFYKLVEEYQRARQEMVDAENELAEYLETKVIQPTQATVQEWNEYERKIDDWLLRLEEYKERRRRAYDAYRVARDELIKILPPGVWLRCGDLAVGKVGDSWGGWHWELETREWGEDLPPLTERSYN